MSTKKLGDLLKEAGLIDDMQLQTALGQQRNWGGKLGAILIDLGFISEEQLVGVMAEKLRIPHHDLFDPPISEPVIKLIKPDIAKKYHVMPVKKEGGSLVLAMFDPLDLGAVDEIRFITGMSIKPCLALQSEIIDAIKKYYDGEEVDRSAANSTRAAWAKGKMEIIRGSDLMMKEAEDDVASLSKDIIGHQPTEELRVRLDALITLLIEKKIISREELMSMVYQKKIGL